MTYLLDAALRYAAHGWHVFPLRPHKKEPIHPGGFRNATTDPDQLTEWWTETPGANLGLAPGPSGLLVADVDGPVAESTARALGLLEEPTLTVQTCRPDFPGRHLYFRHPGGTIGNLRLALTDGQLKRVDGTTPGLEIKADAGYVVLPPSIHPTGKAYRWLTTDTPIQPWPETARLDTPTQRPAIPATIGEGVRDVTLFRIGCALRHLGCAESVILAALRGVNRDCTSPPLDDAVIVQKAASAARYQPGEQIQQSEPQAWGKRSQRTAWT